uniref:DNA methyltransferase n=1 Tax=Sandarakinorhabdus sp. TaxID=1916663 RepID=UPI0035664A32
EAFVRRSEAGEPAGTGRIDLYKPRHFVLEAKQSRLAAKATPDLLAAAGLEAGPAQPAGPRYDALMRDARVQAEAYARALPASEGWPPFLIVCDVGRAFDIYFDWSGMGKDYGPFPNRQGFRIGLLQLRDPAVQALFHAIWTDPRSIDPRLQAVAVTRDVSWRLADVSKTLEADQRHRTRLASPADKSRVIEGTALYLMRILFCMFAEDVGLLPAKSFQNFLAACLPPGDADGDAAADVPADTKRFTLGLAELWGLMARRGGERYCLALGCDISYFNGGLFEHPEVYALGRNEISKLVDAAAKQWNRVEPAIFGTLLEQALTPQERAKLGAHYTPRRYVERLVEATIMEPLRAEWAAVQAAAPDAAPVAAFHARLKALRILDPACGTGNFLYVAMELLLRLEGEVLTLLAELGSPAIPGIVPKQFLGLELNPRAAVIAELVLWIGWLRWRIANDPAAVPEPVLERTDAINFGRPGGYDAVLARTDVGEVDFANPRAALWPDADFIVGNPPFIGGKDLRDKLGSDYAEALWKANPHVPPSADLACNGGFGRRGR